MMFSQRHVTSYLLTLLFGVLLFGYVSPVFGAGTQPIGSTCTDNSDCVTNTCEEKQDGDTVLGKYCVCGVAGENGDQQCADRYGGNENDWQCEQGIGGTYNLNYCQNERTDLSQAPAGSKGSSWWEHLTDTTAAAQFSAEELNKLLKKPSLRINIPGVSFTDPNSLIATEEDGGTYIYFPYLGEYIAPVYKYAVAAIAVVSMLMIIFAGFVWTTSGGNADRVNAAKKHITQSIIGLTIAVTSYALLFLINPELVNFRNLKVLVVEKEELSTPEEADVSIASLPVDPNTTQIPEGIQNITAREFKRDKINNRSVDGWALWQGLSPTQQTTVLPYLYTNVAECPNTQDIITLTIEHCNWKGKKIHKNVVAGLENAISVATRYGFDLCARSSYRSILEETQLWNTGIVARYVQPVQNWKTNEGAIAKPQCSAPHSSGGSIDAYLRKTGTTGILTPMSSLMNNQSQYRSEYFTPKRPYNLVFEQIMFEAGWVRYCQESWHFEYGVTTRYSKWTDRQHARCVFHWDNWVIPIPDDVKANANALTSPTTPIFR